MRDEVTQYEQDRLGNENRKLDELRAQSGQVAGGQEGLREIISNETGTDLIVYSATADVDQAILLSIVAHNSAPSGDNTFHIITGDVDSNNPGQLSNTTRRSVDYDVAGSMFTKSFDYDGKPFTKSIGVRSEFAGQVAVGVIEDRKEETETDTEDTSTP